MTVLVRLIIALILTFVGLELKSEKNFTTIIKLTEFELDDTHRKIENIVENTSKGVQECKCEIQNALETSKIEK